MFESWTIKKVPKSWCFQTVVLEKTLESPVDSKEIKPVNSKGNQPWIFVGRTDAKAEAPILWPPDRKSQLTGKDPDAGKDWRQEEKGVTEDEMAEQHHRLNRHEFQWTPGDGDGQGSLACYRPQSHKESVMTEQLNSNSKKSKTPPNSRQYTLPKCSNTSAAAFQERCHVTVILNRGHMIQNDSEMWGIRFS